MKTKTLTLTMTFLEDKKRLCFASFGLALKSLATGLRKFIRTEKRLWKNSKHSPKGYGLSVYISFGQGGDNGASARSMRAVAILLCPFKRPLAEGECARGACLMK